MSEISVHVKDKHACGHMHEAIFHMDVAKLEGNMQTLFPPLRPARGSFNPMEIETEHTLEFTGSVERMEVRMCACCGLKPKMRLWQRLLGWMKREEKEA